MHWLTMLCNVTVVREGCGKYWWWQIWNHCQRNPKIPKWCILQQMQDGLQKSDSCHQVSERKKVVTSSNDSLACALIDLGAFGSMGVHLPSEKPILPYFSSLSMVAILVCDSHRQAGSSKMTPWHVPSSIWVHFGLWWLIFLVKNRFSHIFPASAWLPYQSLFLRYEVEKGLRAV